MRPVVERIAYTGRQNLRPRFEFFITRSVSGYIFFFNAEAAHGSPFVVVAAEPKFGYVGRLIVFVNLFRRKVTMPVKNRHVFCTVKEKPFCRIIIKKKVFIHKIRHFIQLLFNDYTISASKMKVKTPNNLEKKN